MTTEQQIRMQNLFCMLTYVYRVLNQANYDEVRAERFERAEDLFAAVLIRGIGRQVKHGLCRTYRTRQETLAVMRGKLQIPETLRVQIQHQQKLTCEFDDLSENTLPNQILKTTLQSLLTCGQVKPVRQRALKQLLVQFSAVARPEPESIPWNRLSTERIGRNYEMLLQLCHMVLQSLQQPADPRMGFSEEQMARLYPQFLLEYYHRHHPELEARMGQIPWDLEAPQDWQQIQLLPQMDGVLLLQQGQRVLVLDARYCSRKQPLSAHSLRAEDLYRIYTCVKNLDRRGTGRAAGVLLYAGERAQLQPDCAFCLGGNEITVCSLDLSRSFTHLTRQLDQLAARCFGGRSGKATSVQTAKEK